MTPSPPLRILLVEDHPADVLIIRDSLEQIPDFPLLLSHVDSLQAARDHLRPATDSFDIALLDLGLPDSQGLDTLVALRQLVPDLPVLVLTGLADQRFGVQALTEGAQDYLIKNELQPTLLGRTIRYAIQRHRFTAEIRHSHQQLRLLAARLQAVREDERTRISREVHDVLGQALTGLRMDLHWIDRKFSQSLPPEARPTFQERIAAADLLVASTLATVQRIAVELRPAALDHLGLANAIRDECRRFSSRSTILVETQLPERSRPLHPSLATGCFRILQELLTNVARHSHAQRVRVELQDSGPDLALIVEDDGVGLPPDALDRPSALGLLGIRESALALGALLTFSPASPQGTCATIRAPFLPPPDASHAQNPHRR